ncbi:MAG: hypothetical protein ACT4P3_14510 [Betaproteobacteria bacterium]
MTPPEYAFIASDAARRRARGAVLALNTLGYDARHYGADAAEARRAKAVVFCDVRPDTAKFVFDFADERHLEFAEGAAALTAPTVAIAEAAARRLRRVVEVVPEPFEGARRAPRAPRLKARSRALEWLARRAGLATDAWRTRLMWTGEKPDVETIVGAYPALKNLGAELPLALHCVAPPEALDALLERLQEDAPEAVRFSFEAASPRALSGALEACDFVLAHDARLQREALHAGRLAIGGADPCEAIRRALADPHGTLEELQRAQRQLDETCAPAVVARAWVRIFMKGSR